jgi:serine/threonine-protein kinase
LTEGRLCDPPLVLRQHREVAIKILPQGFDDHPERISRFTREAQVLAALNHPAIAAIYVLEEGGEIRGLVMELVEGPTLADRLLAGPMAIDEVLSVSRTITSSVSNR